MIPAFEYARVLLLPVSGIDPCGLNLGGVDLPRADEGITLAAEINHRAATILCPYCAIDGFAVANAFRKQAGARGHFPPRTQVRNVFEDGHLGRAG